MRSAFWQLQFYALSFPELQLAAQDVFMSGFIEMYSEFPVFMETRAKL